MCEIAIRGEHGDATRSAEQLAAHAPEVCAVAGGDGTIGLALAALLEAKACERTALGLLPLGTGNNAARSFGLRALRDGPAALALAVDAIAGGPRRAVDVGTIEGRPFLGSVAIGMDADVLALRNRLRPRIDRIGLGAGYGLYLGASLASLATRHGAPARLVLDGVEERLPLFGLCAVNAPVYAGPIRFDGPNDAADGKLDVLTLRSGREYVAEYASGWLRYLRVAHGAAPAPSRRLRPSPKPLSTVCSNERVVREVRITFFCRAGEILYIVIEVSAKDYSWWGAKDIERKIELHQAMPELFVDRHLLLFRGGRWLVNPDPTH